MQLQTPPDLLVEIPIAHLPQVQLVHILIILTVLPVVLNKFHSVDRFMKMHMKYQ